MSGKTDGIRKIVSTALGSGLLGQMVENPIHAADSFGVDLNQFGLNKTLLEDSLKIKSPRIPELPTLPTIAPMQ
ncbi:hypothetical protein AAVH_00863 [Aphelenchoides avenae]|nr:hypothetical protein AAVH_00863 [Aphelenchus avenae]